VTHTMVREFQDVSRLVDYALTESKHPALAAHQISYRLAMAAARRRHFDPFRRRDRIVVTDPVDGEDPVSTTIAQLAFIEWAHVNGVTACVVTHAHDLRREADAQGVRVAPLSAEGPIAKVVRHWMGSAV